MFGCLAQSVDLSLEIKKHSPPQTKVINYTLLAGLAGLSAIAPQGGPGRESGAA